MKEKPDKSSGAKRLTTGWICVFLMVWLPLAAVVTGNNFLFLALSMLIGLVGLSNWLSKRNIRGIQVKRILDEEIFAETTFEIKYQINVSVHRGRHKHLESRWGRFGGGDGLPIQSNRAQNLLAPGGLLQKNIKNHQPGASNFTITEQAPIRQLSEGVHVPQVKAGETVEVISAGQLTNRGRVSLKRSLVISNFPFGLANRWRSAGDSVNVIVFPRVEPIDDIFAGQLGDPGSKREEKALFGSIPHAFREYVPGDPYKRIQWKLSARLGKLHVKEMAEEISDRIIVRIESNPSEQALSKAASLICHFCNKGVPMALEAPEFRIGPDNGLEFKRKLLTILALWEERPNLHNEIEDNNGHHLIEVDPQGSITWNFSGDRDHDAA